MSENLVDDLYDKPEDLASQTPIQNRYAFWFHRRGGNKSGTAASNYEESMKMLASFQTVEHFWRIYDHMIRPNDFKQTTDYHLFKDGIKPTWEDPQNKNGGKWMVRLKKGLASRLWEEVVLAIIGEQFDVGHEICGAVVSVRTNEDIISVWNKSADNAEATAKIRDQLRRFLKLPTFIPIEYKKHQDSLTDKSSFRNPTVVWRAPTGKDSKDGKGPYYNKDRQSGQHQSTGQGHSGGGGGGENRPGWKPREYSSGNSEAPRGLQQGSGSGGGGGGGGSGWGARRDSSGDGHSNREGQSAAWATKRESSGGGGGGGTGWGSRPPREGGNEAVGSAPGIGVGPGYSPRSRREEGDRSTPSGSLGGSGWGARRDSSGGGGEAPSGGGGGGWSKRESSGGGNTPSGGGGGGGGGGSGWAKKDGPSNPPGPSDWSRSRTAADRSGSGAGEGSGSSGAKDGSAGPGGSGSENVWSRRRPTSIDTSGS